MCGLRATISRRCGEEAAPGGSGGYLDDPSSELSYRDGGRRAVGGRMVKSGLSDQS